LQGKSAVKGLNRDTLVALVLLVICGVFIAASFDIRETSFGQMESTVWPRIILAALTVLTLVYLGQSLRGMSPGDSEAPLSVRAWFVRYRNAFFCYGLFLVFLLSLPILGMLVGGVLFIFLMLTVLGGHRPRQLVVHAMIACLSFGAMWAIFTFGLRVMLPQGMIFSVL
jgi:hypothetical protein